MNFAVLIGIVLALILVIAIAAVIVGRLRSSKPDAAKPGSAHKDMTVTRKFRKPQDKDLAPHIEYMNADKLMNGASFDLTIFNSDGVVGKREGLGEEEVRQFAAA